MCEIAGQKVVNVNELKCKCGCDEIVVRSYPRQYKSNSYSKSTYISIGIISCKKCGEVLLNWSM